ncbi:MAG: hypothetical protein ABEL76_08265 [Bradymonadaceae bacterium]
MKSQGKEQSPYPRLQAVLPQLSSIGPNSDDRPIYDSRTEAEEHIRQARREEGKTLYLNPVWAIDHTDLRASDIAGWSVTEYIN